MTCRYTLKSKLCIEIYISDLLLYEFFHPFFYNILFIWEILAEDVSGMNVLSLLKKTDILGRSFHQTVTVSVCGD